MQYESYLPYDAVGALSPVVPTELRGESVSASSPAALTGASALRDREFASQTAARSGTHVKGDDKVALCAFTAGPYCCLVWWACG